MRPPPLPLLVYLLGAPGVGKSTLMRRLTARCERRPVAGVSVPHELLIKTMPALGPNTVGAEIGRTRTSFSGTDATAMNIHPRAMAWIMGVPYGLVLAEGARLGTVQFLGAAQFAGYRLRVFHLVAAPAVIADRRAGRPGSQNPSWVAGATTRAARTAEAVGATRLDASQPPGVLADQVRYLVPELETLR